MAERILVVGFGSIGRRHARVARAVLPNATIAVLSQRAFMESPSSDVDHHFTTMAEAINYGPTLAVIASPAVSHLDFAQPLAERGVHLLIEKPISHSVIGVPDVIEACHATGATLMVGYNMRFLSSLNVFRDRVLDGEVGEVMSVRAEVGQFLPSWRSMDYRKTVSAKACLGGGVLLELSHEIDYLRWIFGEVAWIQAVKLTQSKLEIDVEDTAHLILGFASDGNRKPVVASVDLDFVRHDTTRVCTVIGEEGTLRWNALTGTVDVFDEGATAWRSLYVHQAQRDESYVEEWKNFLECVRNATIPRCSGDDGLAVLRIVDAAKQSAKREPVFLQ